MIYSWTPRERMDIFLDSGPELYISGAILQMMYNCFKIVPSLDYVYDCDSRDHEGEL